MVRAIFAGRNGGSPEDLNMKDFPTVDAIAKEWNVPVGNGYSIKITSKGGDMREGRITDSFTNGDVVVFSKTSHKSGS
jgi:hypothetical protein